MVGSLVSWLGKKFSSQAVKEISVTYCDRMAVAKVGGPGTMRSSDKVAVYLYIYSGLVGTTFFLLLKVVLNVNVLLMLWILILNFV